MYGRLIKKEDHLINLEFRTHLTFECLTKEVKQLPEHCELTITEWSPERNIDQNAKYWSIVSEIAKITGTSKTVIHNVLLSDYGELEKVDGEPVEVVLPESYDYLNDKDLHLFPTGEMLMMNDQKYVKYYKLIDSKNLTKKQFSRLIDGAIDERESLCTV